VVYWKPAPLLLEWGCALIREAPPPRPIEHVWQLAALGVAQRSEDAQFLIGNTSLAEANPAPARRHPEEVQNTKDEIGHLAHAMSRFPDELRFLLAQAIARERYTPSEAITLYAELGDLPGIGGEARVRLGAMHLRRGRTSEALGHFERAERLTRDPWVLQLLWTFRGQALIKTGKDEEAIEAYRTARAIQPSAQTASLLLAEALFKAGQRAESQSVAASILDSASVADPYLELVHGDDRFWPRLVTKLRAELRRP
jgi:tetratricopeptide (TPR) repeat protein